MADAENTRIVILAACNGGTLSTVQESGRTDAQYLRVIVYGDRFITKSAKQIIRKNFPEYRADNHGAAVCFCGNRKTKKGRGEK